MSIDPKTAALIQKYDRPVPRYTSYPTAVRFSSSVGAEKHESWLSAITLEKPVSLYIHIPFCRSLCLYCGCNTKALGNNYTPVARYLEALKKEIGRAEKRIGRKQSVSHIHLGGGTPTFLKSKDMEKLFGLLHTSFAVRPDAEISIEIDPRLITEEQINSLAALGVNRVSLGVQDFDPAVQKAIGRIQPYEDVVTITEQFRSAGIQNINFDMMYGLPLQTIETVQDNARKVALLKPGRMALFGYAHVPWMKKNQKVLEQYSMPNARLRYEQFAASKDIWLDAGYKEIGIDHFALPEDDLYIAFKNKKLHRNFMGYVSGEAEIILGFGASAISAFPQGYIQNKAETQSWLKDLENDQSPTARGLILTPDDLPRGHIIEALMCLGAADISALSRPPSLATFEKEGFLEYDGTIVKITETGRPFTRLICSAFDEYFKEKEKRHARAI